MTYSIPDVVAVVKASRDGKINVKREVRDALGVKDGPLTHHGGLDPPTLPNTIIREYSETDMPPSSWTGS